MTLPSSSNWLKKRLAVASEMSRVSATVFTSSRLFSWSMSISLIVLRSYLFMYVSLQEILVYGIVQFGSFL